LTINLHLSLTTTTPRSTYAFNALVLLVGRQEGHMACIHFCFKSLGMVDNVSGIQPKVPCGYKQFRPVLWG